MLKDQKLVHMTGEIIESTVNNSIVNFSYLHEKHYNLLNLKKIVLYFLSLSFYEQTTYRHLKILTQDTCQMSGMNVPKLLL